MLSSIVSRLAGLRTSEQRNALLESVPQLRQLGRQINREGAGQRSVWVCGGGAGVRSHMCRQEDL